MQKKNKLALCCYKARDTAQRTLRGPEAGTPSTTSWPSLTPAHLLPTLQHHATQAPTCPRPTCRPAPPPLPRAGWDWTDPARRCSSREQVKGGALSWPGALTPSRPAPSLRTPPGPRLGYSPCELFPRPPLGSTAGDTTGSTSPAEVTPFSRWRGTRRE